MKTAVSLSLLGFATLLAACSGDETPMARTGARPGPDASSGGVSGTGAYGGGPSVGGASTGGTLSTGGVDASSGSGGFTPNPFTPVFRGIVVDASSGSGFDATKYTRITGVEVCVYDDPTLPCATSTSAGDYEFDGAPENRPFYFSYKKDGFDSVLFPVGATAAGSYVTPFIVMAPTAYSDGFAQKAGVTRDVNMGRIHFAAVTRGAPTDSPFFQVFGNAGFVYLKGYKVSVSPAVNHGPFYVSDAWEVDPALVESSTAGWGFVATTPGDYTLSYAHPTLACGTTSTKVVAGYTTIYVGTICSSSRDGGADGGSSGGTDAASKTDASTAGDGGSGSPGADAALDSAG